VDFVCDNPGEPVPEETFTHLQSYTYCPLSASSMHYDPWHASCSVHVPNSLFAQSLSKFSLACLLTWHPPLHIPYISLPNHYLLFATHAHTVTTCFAVVPRLCRLILDCQPFTCSFTPHVHLTTHLCLLKCHLIFLSYGLGLTSMQHTTSHTTAIQSPSHFQ